MFWSVIVKCLLVPRKKTPKVLLFAGTQENPSKLVQAGFQSLLPSRLDVRGPTNFHVIALFGRNMAIELCFVFQVKEEVNALNKYSHNFSGLYCTCSRPYPDPDDQVRRTVLNGIYHMQRYLFMSLLCKTHRLMLL